MQVVVSLANPGYCELKAIELITEARLPSTAQADVDEKLARATSLLALSRVLRNGATQASE